MTSGAVKTVSNAHPTVDTDHKDAANLMSRMYDELLQLASIVLRRERKGHTLQTTELVHEAYLRLANQRNISQMDPIDFCAAVANVMRRILVDHARARMARKRGEGVRFVPLDTFIDYAKNRGLDLVGLDDALTRLAAHDKRKSRVIELRFFGGLSVKEVARTLNVRRRTIERDWTFAKAWLRDELCHETIRR